jgi:uncharacterized protein (TIGR02145 family)
MYTITNYTIKSELGQGGMATVYLAEDKKFLTNVAVKVLAKEFAHNENIRKRFLAEARNMFKMSHPNIIKVSDLIEEGDTVAFVMEYIEGDTLKDYLERKGKLNNDEIKTIFTQMLAAVAYVHEQGLIHRDIKPSNFMISPNGQVKLLDFGIAKNTDTNSAEYTQTSTSQQMGTPMYMSPEQVNETKSVTAQSDIYSLGVVLWQMVMGQKPYDTKTLSTFQLQSKIVNENLALTNTIWDTSIQKATHKKLESRYTSAQLFLNDLQNPAAVKVDKTVFEKNDDKTIFENKEEATIVENTKTQTITPKIEKTQPTSNTNTANVEKEKKPTGVIIGVIAGVILLIIIFIARREIVGLDDKKSELLTSNYPLIEIGNQGWMQINLNEDKFRNGDPIPEVRDTAEWRKASENQEPAWCYYNNDEANAKYGKLYNWYAVNDRRGLAPEGWHIPTDAEWTTLTDFLGGDSIAGVKMKSTEGWYDNGFGTGTNSSGFSGLPGGCRDYFGTFDVIGKSGYCWSSTEYSTGSAWGLGLYYGIGNVYSYYDGKGEGLSVRCLRD